MRFLPAYCCATNLAEWTAYGRNVTLDEWINEKIIESREVTVSVKESGFCCAARTHRDRMNSRRHHMQCTAAVRQETLEKNSEGFLFVSSCLMAKIKMGLLSIYLSTASLQHMTFRNTKSLILLLQKDSDLLSANMAWQDVWVHKKFP